LMDTAENLGLGLEALHDQITQEIEDAIDAIPGAADTSSQLADLGNRIDSVRQEANAKFDSMAAATADKLTQVKADLTAYSDSYINNVRQTTDNKFDAFAAAVTEKLDNIPVTDLSDYETTQDANDALDALQDYLVELLARHASSDANVLAPVRQALDDVFAANTGTSTRDGAAAQGRGGRTSAPVAPAPAPAPAPVPKPWVMKLETVDVISKAGKLDDGTGTSPTFPSPPVKGCMVLTNYLLPSQLKVSVKCFIYDGSSWIDDPGEEFLVNTNPGDRTTPTTVQKWDKTTSGMSPASVLTQINAPNSVYAFSESGSVHMVFADEWQTNPPPVHVVPYPAGVTYADLPATKNF